MLDLQKSKIKIELSDEPDWFDYDEEGTRFLVSRIGSQKAMNALERLSKPYEHMRRRNKDLPMHIRRKINSQAIAETVLHDWEGMLDDGKEVPYDPKVATEVLSNPQYQHISDFVVGCAEVMEERYKNSFQDAVGNSKG